MHDKLLVESHVAMHPIRQQKVTAADCFVVTSVETSDF